MSALAVWNFERLQKDLSRLAIRVENDTLYPQAAIDQLFEVLARSIPIDEKYYFSKYPDIHQAVEGGEITGAVNNFRWNESPIDLLRRYTHASETVLSFSREWGDEFFSRTATPALRIPDFNMSSVSPAL